MEAKRTGTDDFKEVTTIQSLRLAFMRPEIIDKPGISYLDLGFLKPQSGNAWTVFKRMQDLNGNVAWLDFEDMDMTALAADPEKLSSIVESMHEALPYQCRALIYHAANQSEPLSERARQAIEASLEKDGFAAEKTRSAIQNQL